MAVATELMCQSAIANNPGLEFVGYNEMRIQKGVVLDSDSVMLSLYASKAQEVEKGLFKVFAEIRTDEAKWQQVNAKAEIMLANKEYSASAPDVQKVDIGRKYEHSMEEAYSKYLFHGKFLQAITAIEGWSSEGMVGISKTSLPVKEWFQSPPFNKWLSDPLMTDSAYQLMILWTTEALGAPSLPNYARSYKQFVKDFNGQSVTISAKTAKKGSSSVTADIEFITSDGKVAAVIEGYECTISTALVNAFKNNSLGVK